MDCLTIIPERVLHPAKRQRNERHCKARESFQSLKGINKPKTVVKALLSCFAIFNIISKKRRRSSIFHRCFPVVNNPLAKMLTTFA